MSNGLSDRGGRGPLREAVVVITGASSGIGRATARAFAWHGARLVLAARNEAALQATAGECAMAGAQVLVRPTDVTDAAAVAELARAAADAFGQIDVWINNAGTGLFGPFVNGDIAQHRRVVEINLLGAMNGAAAVLPRFLRQKRGVMISTISIGAFAPLPFAAAYTAAKFGMRGFMAALRQELTHHRGVRICSVFPAVIDTPGFQHGANVSGAELRPAGPIFPPEDVADAIVRTALRPRDEVCVGWPTPLVRMSYGLAPALTERALGVVFRRYVRGLPVASERAGNLFRPSAGRMTARGGWRGDSGRSRRSRPLAWTAAGLVGVGTLALATRLMRGSNGG